MGGIGLIETEKIKTNELFLSVPPYLSELFGGASYPWEIVGRIKDFVSILINLNPCGFERRGGDVLIGSGVKISKTAEICGGAVIGNGVEIRAGAYIRGGVIICDGCVVGNSTELKNCIVLPRAQLPHYNYVGDSIIGSGAHLGAGAICSNLRSDKKSVFVRGEKSYETGMRKLGAIIGDGAEIGCGSVLCPGAVVGRNAVVYPLSLVRGIVPENCILKSEGKIVARENN